MINTCKDEDCHGQTVSFDKIVLDRLGPLTRFDVNVKDFLNFYFLNCNTVG